MDYSLCDKCRKFAECFLEGVGERDNCEYFDPLSFDEIVERERFISAVMVGSCQACGSDNTVDCDGDPSIDDPTVGHCLDCNTYWCIECGKILKEPFKCGHWDVCEACSKEKGYMSPDEFYDKVCPKCEHWKGECTLGFIDECEQMYMYRCPYEFDVSECPRIRRWKRHASKASNHGHDR